MSDKRHYFLVAGLLLVELPNPENPEETALVEPKHNAVVYSEKNLIDLNLLAKAQEALQMIFHQRSGGDNSAMIRDVTVLNIIYMGHMTEEEFNYRPRPAANEGGAA